MIGHRRWRWWAGSAAIALLVPTLYCAVAKPPDLVDYRYPLGSGETEEITREFWRVFQAQDRSAITRLGCEYAHRLPDDERTMLAETPGEAPLPPVGAAAPPAAPHATDLICRLEEAALRHPEDGTLANLLAAAYVWRAQTNVAPAEVDPDLHEAPLHAHASVRDGNALAGGFEAAATWLLGFRLADERYKKRAYDQMVTDTLSFAAFHGFVEGASMSGMLDPEHPDPRFDYQWAVISFLENLETCIAGSPMRGRFELPEGMHMNRFLMNTAWVLSRVTGRGYCYNNAAAPYNFMGLFVAQGDAYLKRGEIELARIAYENALASPNAESWPHAQRVRERLADLDGARRAFREYSGQLPAPQQPHVMMMQAEWYCATCHQSAPRADR